MLAETDRGLILHIGRLWILVLLVSLFTSHGSPAGAVSHLRLQHVPAIAVMHGGHGHHVHDQDEDSDAASGTHVHLIADRVEASRVLGMSRARLRYPPTRIRPMPSETSVPLLEPPARQRCRAGAAVERRITHI